MVLGARVESGLLRAAPPLLKAMRRVFPPKTYSRPARGLAEIWNVESVVSEGSNAKPSGKAKRGKPEEAP